MRRTHGTFTALLALCAAFLPACARPTAGGAHDFSGIWMQDRGNWAIAELPFTAAGAEKHASKQAPSAVEACTVHHFGQIITGPLPVEILQTPGRVTLLYENNHEVRRVFLDGRGHPADLFPTTMGHSIGWWEGDTLVIETTGLRAGWFRPEGVPYTEHARVLERLERRGDTIHVTLTLEDGEYYTRPVEVARELTLMPDGEIFEDLCVVSDYRYE